MENYTPIHLHSTGSLLDGFNKIGNLTDKVKELNMKAVAITDHGNLSESYSFWKTCNDKGIKPILGVEAYHTLDRFMISKKAKEKEEMALTLLEKDIASKVGAMYPHLNKGKIDIEIKNYKKEHKLHTKKGMLELAKEQYSNITDYDTKNYHLILLAKNQKGWDNLIQIMAIANEEGAIIKNKKLYPFTDNELLKKYSEGIICTTACISSVVAHNIIKGNIDYAEEKLLELKEIFGEDLYVEIQPLLLHEQIIANEGLIKLAKEHNIKLVASTDSHYTNKEDYEAHDVLMCIGMEKKIDDPNRIKYLKEYWIKSYDEMLDGFKNQNDSEEYLNICKEALSNTNLIAEQVEHVQLGSKKELLPNVDVPKGYTSNEWITAQCFERLYKYLIKKNKLELRRVYEARLNHELNVITKKGFASYILIVQDAIEWGNKNGAPFGPGRGSGSGSLVLFLLGIIKGTDPIEYNLLFSRFLTMDRKLNPDIDCDVCMVNRQRLITYLENKYGHDNVCQVGTVTKLGVKNGIKDVAKAFNIDFAEANNISKKLDELIEGVDITFEKIDALKDDNENSYNEWVKIQEQYPQVIKFARLLEGTSRSAGTHAGGVLITPVPVNNYFPTRVNDKGKKITEWDKDIVEQASGVKYDFLGLKTVSVINLTLHFIKANYDIDITLDELYEDLNIRNDENTFDMLKASKTEGVFQMESNLFKTLAKDIQPDSINDLIAITALGR